MMSSRDDLEPIAIRPARVEDAAAILELCDGVPHLSPGREGCGEGVSDGGEPRRAVALHGGGRTH